MLSISASSLAARVAQARSSWGARSKTVDAPCNGEQSLSWTSQGPFDVASTIAMSLLETISRLATAPTLSWSYVPPWWSISTRVDTSWYKRSLPLTPSSFIHRCIHNLGFPPWCICLHTVRHEGGPATGLSAWRSSLLSEQTFFHSLNLWALIVSVYPECSEVFLDDILGRAGWSFLAGHPCACVFTTPWLSAKKPLA